MSHSQASEEVGEPTRFAWGREVVISAIGSLLVLAATDPWRLIGWPFRIVIGIVAGVFVLWVVPPRLCLLKIWLYLKIAGRYEGWLRRHLAAERQSSNLLRTIFEAPSLPHETPYAATAYVLSPDRKRLLMIYNDTHCRWLPPGGRLLTNDMPHDAVLKRVCSETGLPLAALTFSGRYHPVKVDHLCQGEPVTSHPTPWIVQMELLEQRGGMPFHYDFVYVLESSSDGPLKGRQNPQWLSGEQVVTLAGTDQPFPNVRKLVAELLASLPPREQGK